MNPSLFGSSSIEFTLVKIGSWSNHLWLITLSPFSVGLLLRMIQIMSIIIKLPWFIHLTNVFQNLLCARLGCNLDEIGDLSVLSMTVSQHCEQD